MEDGFRLEHVDLSKERNIAEIKEFLKGFDLGYDADVAFTVAVRDPDGALVATGSYAGEVLRNIAVDERLQGAGLTATVLSELMQRMAREGITHYFLFTRPAKAFLFANLGFTEIARAEPYAALLESGLGSVASYCETVAEQAGVLPPDNRAAIVMNANPFTKGHRALVEKAVAEQGGVIIFVVSEERSVFPFADRLRLIKAGTADMPNVVVVPGGPYIISSATFPTYFTRDADQAIAQAHLDIMLFARQIAPRLGITTRYIGEEPYSPVTEVYNHAMFDILPGAGVSVHIMPRIAVDGVAVSASTVRARIREGHMDQVRLLVPETTFAYLQAEENEDILEKVRFSQSRH